MEVLVVGAGEMGRWFGELVESKDDFTVTFLDADVQTARTAASEIDADVAEVGTERPVDIVVVAVPIPATQEAIETYAPLASRAVVDVTGTMNEPLETMERVVPDVERSSFHPLFAPANEPGNVPVVIDSGGPVTETLCAVLSERGNYVFETTPEEHDTAMETVQSRAHTAVLAYALAADDVSSEFQTPVSETLSDLAEQVASGEPRVYADIQTVFDGADDVANAAREIADADRQTFEQLYSSLQRERGR